MMSWNLILDISNSLALNDVRSGNDALTVIDGPGEKIVFFGGSGLG
jgi:hypothetical protein